MKVRDIMTSPVVTVRLETPVADVARLLLKRGLSGLPVVDRTGTVRGLVTEGDVVAKHARPHVPLYLGILGYVIPIETQARDEEVRRVLAVTAGELMTNHVRTIAADAPVDDAATLMVDHDVNPIPVLEGDTLVGIVSRHDILRLLVREDESAD